MQSSTTAVCRALVMVACLIAIPLAALFGTSLPDLVNRVFHRGKDSPSASSGDSRQEAPPFGPDPRAGPGADVPGDAPDDDVALGNRDTGFSVPSAWRGGFPGPPGAHSRQEHPQTVGVAAGDAARAQPNWPRQGLPAGNPGQGAVLADYEARPGPKDGSPVAWPEDLGGESRGNEWSFGPTGSGASAASGASRFEPGTSELVPVARTAAGPTDAPPAAPVAAPLAEQARLGPIPQAPRPADQFTYIQRRLRQLGATYYLLETWGAEGQYYRFHARMAVGGSASYVRQFEATDTDAVRAMAKVLEQVEAWRAGF